MSMTEYGEWVLKCFFFNQKREEKKKSCLVVFPIAHKLSNSIMFLNKIVELCGAYFIFANEKKSID
jgi:hypothetical protein